MKKFAAFWMLVIFALAIASPVDAGKTPVLENEKPVKGQIAPETSLVFEVVNPTLINIWLDIPEGTGNQILMKIYAPHQTNFLWDPKVIPTGRGTYNKYDGHRLSWQGGGYTSKGATWTVVLENIGTQKVDYTLGLKVMDWGN